MGNAEITIRDAGSTAPKTKLWGKMVTGPQHEGRHPEHEAGLPPGAVGVKVGGPLNILPQISTFRHYLTAKQCENSPRAIQTQII